MKKHNSAFIMFFIVFFCSFSLLKAQEEPKYTNDSFARMNYISGNVYIQRGPDLGFEEGIINMPVEEGDRLGTTDGRAEIYLGKNNYLRLDNNTKVDFLNLPKKGYELIRLRVFSGNIYLSVNGLNKEKSIEIHTADVSFYVLDKGLYRIDVSENKKTAVYVFRGVMEAAGEEGSQLLKSEQTLEVSEGRFDSRPERFLAVAEDNFDRWSDSRESNLRAQIPQKYLPEELSDFEAELSANGEWIDVPPYGWVWKPGNVDENWRPYYNGLWVSLSLCGLTWIPYEPWGWAPFHYGRWGWGPSWGWYWIPSSFWGPAWVDWWWGYDYCGWAPLSWWGYPVVIIDGVFYGDYYGPYYPYNSRALTTVRKDQLKAKNISGVALGQESLKSLDKIRMTGEAPTLKPAFNKVSVDEMKGNKVFLKKETGEMAAAAERNLRPSSMKSPEKIEPALRGEKGVERALVPEERRIRRIDTTQIESGYESRSVIRKESFGYPSSPDISIKKYSSERTGSSYFSSRDEFYRYLQGGRSLSQSYSSGKSISKGRTTSSGSARSVSSSSRSHSSGSHPSSSMSGGVKKKN